MAEEKKFDPSEPSTVYNQFIADWLLIRHVRGGARVVREQGALYLPKFGSEDDTEYKARLGKAPFSAHYEDSTRTLAAKPFSKEVKLQGQYPPDIAIWAEDIDLAGNNLHVFTSTAFTEALHMGLVYILVDMPKPGTPMPNLAAERAAGLRPYFRMITVDDMLGIYAGVRNGQTYIRQMRFRDNQMVLDDIYERVIQRVRVIDDIDGIITQRVWILDPEKKEWNLSAEEGGPLIGINEIPLVPISFGMEVAGRFGVKPPMLDLAHKQIEHFQHLNRLDQIFDFAGFPMLQAEGMAPPTRQLLDGTIEQLSLTVGPRAILFAPPAQAGDKPKWSFIEPSATAIKELREHKRDLESEMRTLGLQPHMPTQGIQNMAATTSAISAARTHSAVQSWALRTKDGIEQALVYMARWKKLAETAEVFVHTDFAAEVLGDADEKLLLEMNVLGKISNDTLYDELQRRDVLGPQFDKAAERGRIEMDGDALGMGTGDNDEPEIPALPAPPVTE